MMNKLFELGISEEEFKLMLELCFNIMDMDECEVEEKINILKYVGCDLKKIKNIIVSNPEYLELYNEDIIKLIQYLRCIGVDNISMLFESNPYFLNYEVFEIEDYINKREQKGLSLEDVVNEIINNPYIIDYQ